MSVCYVLCAAQAHAQTELKVGAKLPVPSWQRVTLENAVHSGNNAFGVGDSCVIGEGGVVTILSLDKTPEILVEYSIATTQYGTRCPNGARFFLYSYHLANFGKEMDQVLKQREALLLSVLEILDGESEVTEAGSVKVGETRRVPGRQWIDVLAFRTDPTKKNPKDYTVIDFGPRSRDAYPCGIAEGGHVTILGFLPDKSEALVEYDSGSKPEGTLCFSGAITLLSVKGLTFYPLVSDEVKKAVTSILDGQSIIKESGSVKVGETRLVPGGQWVDVLALRTDPTKENPKDYRVTGFTPRGPGTCRTEEGGHVTVLGFLPNKGEALVEYDSPSEPGGSACTSGMIALLSVTEFRSYSLVSNEVKKAVTGILEGQSIIKESGALRVGDIRVVPMGALVNVIARRAEPQAKGYELIGFRARDTERFRIKKDGTVKILGFMPDERRALVEYEIVSEARGTACPSGAIFLLDASSLQTFRLQ